MEIKRAKIYNIKPETKFLLHCITCGTLLMEFLQHPSLISELKAVADGVSFGHVCAYTKTHDVELIDIQGQVGSTYPQGSLLL